MPPVDQDLVTAALLDAVAASVAFAAPAATVEVYDREAPAGVARPYLVVYPLGPSSIGGAPLGDAASDAAFTVQVAAVGDTARQAEWALAKARAGLLAQDADAAFTVPIAVPGGVVTWREWQSEDPSRAEGTFHVVSDRYVIFTTRS